MLHADTLRSGSAQCSASITAPRRLVSQQLSNRSEMRECMTRTMAIARGGDLSRVDLPVRYRVIHPTVHPGEKRNHRRNGVCAAVRSNAGRCSGPQGVEPGRTGSNPPLAINHDKNVANRDDQVGAIVEREPKPTTGSSIPNMSSGTKSLILQSGQSPAHHPGTGDGRCWAGVRLDTVPRCWSPRRSEHDGPDRADAGHPTRRRYEGDFGQATRR